MLDKSNVKMPNTGEEQTAYASIGLGALIAAGLFAKRKKREDEE